MKNAEIFIFNLMLISYDSLKAQTNQAAVEGEGKASVFLLPEDQGISQLIFL